MYATPTQYPWMVRIVGGCALGKCGGSLVSPRIVLSAYHCSVDPTSRSKKACDHSDGKRLAILGQNRIDMKNLHSYYTIPVIAVKSPPNAWLEYKDYYSHDFAMLVLEKPAKYSEYVSPICLPHSHAEYGGKWAEAAGWGRTDAPSVSRAQSPRLKTVSLKVNWRKYKHRFMFGTFLKKNDYGTHEDPCLGDSGYIPFPNYN